MVGFVGSRSLPVGFAALVRRVVRAFLRSGADIAVGCSDGADALVIRSVVEAGAASRLTVFAVGDRLGNGFWRLSAFPAVCVARDAGARVLWRAGGVFGSLRVRLARRSEALVRAVAASSGRRGLVAFVSVSCPLDVSPSRRFAGRGSGSWGAVALAVGLGLPVVVFPCGVGPSALPGWWGGHWVPVARSGLWAGAFRFVPSRRPRPAPPRGARNGASGAVAAALAPSLLQAPPDPIAGIAVIIVIAALIVLLLFGEDRSEEIRENFFRLNLEAMMRAYEQHLRNGGDRLSWLASEEGRYWDRVLRVRYDRSPSDETYWQYRRYIDGLREVEVRVAESLGLIQFVREDQWLCPRCGEVLVESETNIFTHRH